MKMHIVAVYDKRATEYSPPQVYTTLGVAERAFSDAVNNKESNLNRHPTDYNLQVIGSYDTETGVVTPKAPEILAEAAQFHNERE